jgi:hypothetical protein
VGTLPVQLFLRRTILSFGVVILCCAFFVSKAKGSDGGGPKISLLTLPADPESEAQAAYVYHLLRAHLKKSPLFFFVESDEILGNGQASRAAKGKVDLLIEQGKKAYEGLDLKTAISAFQNAKEEFAPLVQDAADRALYADILIYLGAVNIFSKDVKRGKGLFRNALIFNKKAKLDPMLFPPMVAAAFKDVSAEFQKAGSGALDVRPIPAGTEIWIDGRYHGIGPQKVDKLPKGEHVIRLARRGYASQTLTREVMRGGEELIRQELVPLPGYSRMSKLIGAFQSALSGNEIPSAAEELMRWLGVERLFLIQVTIQGKEVAVRGIYLDRASRRVLKSLQSGFDPQDPTLKDRLDLFFTSLYMDVGESPATAVAQTDVLGEIAKSMPTPKEPIEAPKPISEKKPTHRKKSIWTTWWFWTAAGVLVLGGTGAALYLTAGGSGGGSKFGDVVVRF